MFTKKLEDQFSADLLNTVKGILDEAKKCPKDCDCEKCEKEEDEDEMKEGFASAAQRKAVWATYADGGKGHPDNKKKKLTKEDQDFIDSLNNEMFEEIELDEAVSVSHDRYIRSHGKKASGGEGNWMFTHKERGDAKGEDRFEAPRGKFSDAKKHAQKWAKERGHHTIYVMEEVEQIDEWDISKMPHDKLKLHSTVPHGRYTRKEIEAEIKRRKSTGEYNSNYQAEEADYLETDLKKRKKNNDKAIKDMKKMGSPMRNPAFGEEVELTPEEKEFIAALNNEMWDEIAIAEGRGRPPKEGTAAWHARQKQADDDMVALGMQLRKAKSMNKKVRFMDGNEHHVLPHHADRFEDHMAARKTSQEKAAFQKQAHKSHADFVKAVSAPVPHASKDTGEIVKYRH